MIFYFTGTGNSRYVAEKLAACLNDKAVRTNEKIKAKDYKAVETDENLVFVAPTYAWRMPLIFEEWIRKTDFVGAKRVWFVMDCGGEIGDAAKYNVKLCEEKGLNYMGTYQIVMPENYIAMFDVPSESESRSIVANAVGEIEKAASFIASGNKFPTPRSNAYDKLMSHIVNPVFYALFVKSKAFRTDEKCVGCGKCVELCPLNNLKLSNGKPVWGNDCTHCMACICYCPTQAIEYGKKSVGKRRYQAEE